MTLTRRKGKAFAQFSSAKRRVCVPLNIGIENPDAFHLLSLGMLGLAAILIGYMWFKKWR